MITVQTLSGIFSLPIQPDSPLSTQLQNYNPEYHIDFQHLINLETGAPMSITDFSHDGDSIGLIMLTDVNVEIQDEIPVGREIIFDIRWTPSHIGYGESYDTITVIYDHWYEENPPFFYSTGGQYRRYKYNELSLMLEQNLECNWPPTQRYALINNITDLIYNRLNKILL